MARVVGALFFEGPKSALAVARTSAEGRVDYKIDKTGTQRVPDLVAAEAAAKKMVETASEIIAQFRKRGSRTQISDLPVNITQSTAREIIVALSIEQCVKDGHSDRAIQFIDKTPWITDRVCFYIADLIDGVRGPLEFPLVEESEYAS